MSDYDRGFSEAIEAAAAALENECADNPHLENFYLPTPLKYAADLVRSLKRPADQDGWKLVPVEPTKEMYSALMRNWKDGAEIPIVQWALGSFVDDYKSMLASAPTPEAK